MIVKMGLSNVKPAGWSAQQPPRSLRAVWIIAASLRFLQTSQVAPDLARLNLNT